MGLQIEFDITIDGITPNEFVDWYKYNPNSGSSYSFEYEGDSFPIGEVITQPRPSHPIFRIDIFVIYCNEAIFRSLGLSEEEIKKRMNDLKLANTDEVDGKLIIDPLWDSVRSGILTVLPFGSSCQVVGESISNPIVVKNIASRILKVFRERAHNNLIETDGGKIQSQKYSRLSGARDDEFDLTIEDITPDLFSQWLETGIGYVFQLFKDEYCPDKTITRYGHIDPPDNDCPLYTATIGVKIWPDGLIDHRKEFDEYKKEIAKFESVPGGIYELWDCVSIPWDDVGWVEIIPIGSSIHVLGYSYNGDFENENYKSILMGKVLEYIQMVYGDRLHKNLTPQSPTNADILSKIETFPSRKHSIDQACIQWANRGYMAGFHMSDFLEEFEKDDHMYIGVTEFKRALKDAGKRGLIEKVKGRWRGKN